MQIQIFGKAGGDSVVRGAEDTILLQAASVVEMPFGPEAVARFSKSGSHLILVLKDGTRICIEDFFRTYEDGSRSDLVFLDQNGATWWAQYQEPWTHFDIAEIETGIAAFGDPTAAFGALAGGLGLLGLAGGGGGRPAPTPVATDDAAEVLEAGTASGAGTPQVTGTLLSNDGSDDPDAFQVIEVTWDGAVVPIGEAVETAYGTLTINPDGTYVYELDNDRPATEALPEGALVTEVFGYTIENASGATSSANLTMTVTGSNDAPGITGVSTGSVAEGGPLTETGQLEVEDADTGDSHTWAIAAGESGAYGTFAVDASGEWTYVLDDTLPAVQALGLGDTLTDTITVTVTDSEGATGTQVVTVTIDGVNDRPVAADDASFTPAGSPVTLDVRDNDTDVDDGEADALTVTTVAGQPISVGVPVAVTGGTVTIDAGGALTFTPDPGFTGTVSLPYGIDDGSGGADATDEAVWTVTVDPLPGISISDDAGPAGPGTPDGTLSTLDDLTAVALDGQVPGGGTLVSVSVTDGTTTVTIPASAITVNPDGTFGTTADLSGLTDGPLTVTLEATDRDGAPATATDDIEKDTETTVAIDPVTVREGEVPTITGTSGPGDEVRVTIDGGTPVTVTAGPDGRWTYTPPAPLADPAVTISAEATDPVGNTATTDREVIPAIVADQVPGGIEDLVVDEADLPGGATVTGTLALGPSGAVPATVVLGGTTITAAELAASGTTPVGPIATDYGTITVTDYDPATGELTFDYALTGATGDHGAAGTDLVRETIDVAVTDDDGDVRETSVVVAVRDDVPEVAVDGTFAATLTASDADLGTDPQASFAGLFDVDGGADGATVTYALSAPLAASGLVDGASGAPIVLTLEGGEVVGRVGGTGPDAGEIAVVVSVDPDTGEVTLDQQRVLDHGASDTVAFSDGAVVLTATVTDGDGDVATQDAPIGARLTFADDLPVAVDETPIAVTEGDPAIGSSNLGANLLDNDAPGADGARVNSVTYVDDTGSTQTVAVPAGSAGTPGAVTLTAQFGTLEVRADGTWSFTPDASVPNPGGAAADASFSYDLIDGDGDVSNAAVQPITIGDGTAALGGLTAEADGGDARADESGLPAGTGAGGGASTVTGTFTAISSDEISSLVVSQGSASLTIITNGSLEAGPLTLTSALGSTLTITGYDETTGVIDYSYVLADGETHGAAGRDEIFEAFDLTLTDSGSEVATGTLSVAIIDDVPQVAPNGAFAGSLEASDATLGTDPSASFAGLFDVDGGADGAAVTYALSAPETASGLVDGETGAEIELSVVGGVVVGTLASGPDAGETAFTVSVDSTTGEVTLDQRRVLDHGTDDVVSIADAAVVLTATVTDGDGDVATQAAAIGDRLTFADDLPVAVAEAPLTVEEGAAAIGTAAGDPGLLDNDTAGADGARVSSVTYVDDTGTTRTVAIPAGSAGTAPLAAQFGTLQVNADGTWAFTPDAAVQHSGGAAADAGFSYAITDGDGDVSGPVAQPIDVTDTAPVAADDAAVDVDEGAGAISGDVTDNDTVSADGTPTVRSFTYTDAAGDPQTQTFDATTTTATVTTPTGSLTVNADGTWSFDPADAFDHGAAGADADAGSFTYTLVDGDGTVSGSAAQDITVNDTDPGAGGAAATLDEDDLAGGTDGADATTTTVPLGLTQGADDISDVVFVQADIDAALPTLTSGGETVTYAVSPDGHTLTATAGTGASAFTVFTAVIGNPTDPDGGDQDVTLTLSAPIDQSGAQTVLTLPYDVRDTDTAAGDAVSGNVTLTIVDDAPGDPGDEAEAQVAEGGASVGAATAATGLLANDPLGADGGRVSGISYTGSTGTAQTATVGASGTTVTTRYGELTVNPDGTWSYTSDDQADHARPGNDTELSDDFTYVVTDGDGNVSTGSGTQPITVLDTVPEVGTPEDRTVREANLPNGTSPDAGALTVTGSLDVTERADGVATTITSTPTGLTSGGVALQYVTAADGRSVEAFAGPPATADRVFTLALTDADSGAAGYTFTLEGSLDHDTDPGTGDAIPLDLDFGFEVEDGDEDTATGAFTITVEDDAPAATIERTINEDEAFTFNASADATAANTQILQGGSVAPSTPNPDGSVTYALANGTATVAPSGAVTYEPADDFSGTETFVTRTDDGVTVEDTTVTATVNPVSDEIPLGADRNVDTLEDTAVALGVTVPAIQDDGTPAGNNPISERIGTVTLSGLPEGAVLEFGSSGTFPVPASGIVEIVLSDVATVNGTTGDVTMTAAEYGALEVLPPPDDSSNFTVTASVTSFEVDGSGDVLSGVPGATTNEDVTVRVEAVTDDAELLFDTGATTVANTDSVTYADATNATVALQEDARFDLTSILEAAYGDLDGSEVRSLLITNGNDAPIFVNGTTVATNGSIEIDFPSTGGDESDFPTINFGAGRNVSGTLDGIEITLVAQDEDADGFDGGAPGADGVAEADTSNNTVTLTLEVEAVAGDVPTSGFASTTSEDTPVAFLRGVRTNDTNATAGAQELVDSVSFEVPTGWTLTEPGSTAAAPYTLTTTGGVTTITFDGGDTASNPRNAREAVLDAFTITPPPHSSADATIALTIATTDGADTASAVRNAVITVEPVAEVVNGTSDDLDADDLSLTPGVEYAVAGREDDWFDLNSDGSSGPFSLEDGWDVEDPNEDLFALLTPSVPGESAIGAQFRWVEGGATVTKTFTGAPVEIPVDSLSTAEFLPPENVAGTFKIDVQALSRDFDDDDPSRTDEAISGSAELTNINVAPVADAVALTLTARALGIEDTDIPLAIRPSSSDPSETFDVTIGTIPVGATVTYGTSTFTATAGNQSFQITDFDSSTPLSILPPDDSNEDFDLTITAVSVDTVNGVTDTSAPVVQTINVAVTGDADDADVTATPQTYVEDDLDGGADVVQLSELVTVALTDTDPSRPVQSETLTVRVSGLPDGFDLSEGTLVSPPSATGAGRVWTLTTGEFASAEIEVPANFSGTQQVVIEPVTTENDGDSNTGAPVTTSFTVTPSPEAVVSSSATIVEDEITSLNVRVVPVNGDDDEFIAVADSAGSPVAGVRIRVDEASDDDYTLYLGTGPGAQTLPAAGLNVVTDGGVDYYELTAAQAATLAAETDPELDGPVGEFELQYLITDDAFGSTTGTGPVTDADYRSVTFTLTATPVTDAPDATITAITADDPGTTTVSEDNVDPDATPDQAVLTQPDTVTVSVNVASDDLDGSERVVRILIDDVPAGATVVGADALGGGSWLLSYDGAATPQLSAGGASIDIEFDFGPTVADTTQVVSITTQVQDRGDQAAPGTVILEDTVTWRVETAYGGSGAPDAAVIDEWSYNGAGVVEDDATQLSDLFVATLDAQSAAENIVTIQLSDVPPGADISGMTRTTIGGEEVFTASVTVPAQANVADARTATQAAVENLLDSITITAPPDSNTNNTPGNLPFTAELVTAVQGGATDNRVEITPTVPVTPVTDEADITISVGPSDADGQLDESDPAVPIRIDLSNPADGDAANVVGGNLYLQIDPSDTPTSETLTSADGSTTYTRQTNPPGVPPGDYFVIPGVDFDTPVDLIYTPDPMVARTIDVTATILNQEDGSSLVLTDSESRTLTVEIGNDGATLTSAASTGAEAADGENDSLIELQGLSATLNDADGSEEFVSILLTDVPQGFVVYVGADQASAAPASNAGGDGTTNTWVLSGPGQDLPPYVAILPPQYYSGTVTGLSLVATSGETALDDARADSVPVGDVTVTPVANGAEVRDSTSFGTSGRIFPLNLNAALVDGADATTSTAAPDANTETATVVLKGLGPFASFYTGATPTQITSNVSYDAGDDEYTITGLTQDDIDTLAARQAAEAINDQDNSTPELDIGVTVTTVDGGDESDPEAATLTLSLFDQLATSGDDVLLTTGAALDALDGDDTVDLRADENLDGATLDTLLDNVETIDLGIEGGNAISTLTPDDVRGITDERNALTITGTTGDSVSLGAGWTDAGGGVYTGTSASEAVTLTIDSDVDVV